MKKTKKLTIRATTLRNLSHHELVGIHGAGSNRTCINATCTCPPTYVGCDTGQCTLTGQWCV